MIDANRTTSSNGFIAHDTKTTPVKQTGEETVFSLRCQPQTLPLVQLQSSAASWPECLVSVES